MTDEEVFQHAIELADSERGRFLAGACGDEAQRERVKQLVSAHQCDDSLLDTEAHSMAPGAVLLPQAPQTIGDFEILRELGHGGMGVAYEARQNSLNRLVALKVLSSGLGLSSKAILRFRREAEAAGKLHHTNIVPIYTTGEDRGIHFYAMERIDGPSLDRIINDVRSESGRSAWTSVNGEDHSEHRSVDSGSRSGSGMRTSTQHPKRMPISEAYHRRHL